MFEVTKNCYFFPRSLQSLGDQLNLYSHDAKVYKMFSSIVTPFWNIHFGISFPWQCSVFVQRRLSMIISFLSLKTLRTTLLSLLFKWNSYFPPTFSIFWVLLYSYFFIEGTWKPLSRLFRVLLSLLTCIGSLATHRAPCKILQYRDQTWFFMH